MTPQMESGQPMREDPGYGRYEGNQTYAPPPQYGAGPQYDDEFVDGLAQRISQRMAQGPRGKIQPNTSREGPSAGQRLALAIVSIVLLIPLASILLAGVGGITGLISFGAACFVIFLINAVFNNPFHQ
jgi:hypothetical protein